MVRPSGARRVAFNRGKAPETGPAEGVYALAMVEGSVRSAEEGRPLDMAALLGGIDL